MVFDDDISADEDMDDIVDDDEQDGEFEAVVSEAGIQPDAEEDDGDSTDGE